MFIDAKNTIVTFSLLLLSGATFAADTVNFQGLVSTQTCDITVEGSTSPTLLLPTVDASEFTGIGSTALTTPFNMMITNCPPNVAQTCSIGKSIGLGSCDGDSQPPLIGKSGEAKVNFIGNNVTSGGYLGNTASTQAATGVALVIGTTPTQHINLSGGWVSGPGEGIWIPHIGQGGSTAVLRTYYVSYISTSTTITPGKVRASMQYSLTYP